MKCFTGLNGFHLYIENHRFWLQWQFHCDHTVLELICSFIMRHLKKFKLAILQSYWVLEIELKKKVLVIY